MTTSLKTITLATALLALPVAAGAQSTDTTTQNDAVTTSSESDGVAGNERQGVDFPWGLLGLIGLAGLAGRRVVEQRREVTLGGPTNGPRSS